MGVEAYFERPGHGGHPAPELVFGIFKALGYVVDGLVLLVLVGLYGGGRGFEGPVLGFVAQGVQKLSVSGQESSTVSLDGSIFFAETELNSEPVDLEEKSDIFNKKLFDKPHTEG